MPYKIERQYEGCYHVVDTEDGERAARVSMFLPGPMVSVSGQGLYSPDLARLVAEAMTLLADEIDLFTAPLTIRGRLVMPTEPRTR